MPVTSGSIHAEPTLRTLLVACCCVLLACSVATPARAGFPPYWNSTVPPMIPVVGHDAAGNPDPVGDITISVRDLANNPVAGAMVVLDLSACTELRLCAGSHDPNVFVDCSTKTVRRLTDANGLVHFRVMGWSVGVPGTPGAPYNSAKVYADGVLLASPSVSIYDLDGHGLGAADLSAWLTDFFSGSNAARDDYDATQTVAAADLSAWLKAFFAGGSIANCVPEGLCP